MIDLDENEQKHVRVAMRFLQVRLRGLAALAKALSIDYYTAQKAVTGARPVTARVAFRVARLVDVGIDDLLAGRFVPEGICPHCGRAPSDFGPEETVAESAPRPDGPRLVK